VWHHIRAALSVGDGRSIVTVSNSCLDVDRHRHIGDQDAGQQIDRFPTSQAIEGGHAVSMPIALSWSGRFAISIRAASGGHLAAFCAARWRAGCRRPSDCRSVRRTGQVVCMAGGGGFPMLLGDLLTVVQENVPIKIVVIDNGKFGFIDIEQKSAVIEPIFTELKNPDLGKVAEAMGLWGRCVTKAGSLRRRSWTGSRSPVRLCWT
jgi:Thiamine pyrophosphate enzyme, C-terminal TPP binding domain